MNVALGPTALAARDRLLAELGEPGERLGAERDLAEKLGVSRSTIRAALADLERSGVIRRSRGRAGGIFVAERKVERDLTSLAGLPAYLRRPRPPGLSSRPPGGCARPPWSPTRTRRPRWATASRSKWCGSGWPTASRS